MWHALVATHHASPAYIVGFLILWSLVMGTYLHFRLRVAPAALRRWADAEGYKIVAQKWPGPFDWFSVASGSGQHVFRVVVRDREGQERRGLIAVGTPEWFCTSSSRCPVIAQWDAGPGPDPIRAWVEGSFLTGTLTIDRLVLGFATMDLMLAFLVLAFELLMLLGAAIGIDRLSANVPFPCTREDYPFGTVQFLGMFALYLPALITLSAGGVGLMRRKPWAYYWHLAGAVCVAVFLFGIVYTIPAVLVAIQPEFKNYCLGKPGPKTPADLIDEM